MMMKSDLSSQTYTSVWDALEDTPEAAEHMKLKSGMMIALEQQIAAKSWTEEDAAQRMKISLSRMADLVQGEFDQFSLDELLNMLVGAGLRLHFTISEAAASPQKSPPAAK